MKVWAFSFADDLDEGVRQYNNLIDHKKKSLFQRFYFLRPDKLVISSQETWKNIYFDTMAVFREAIKREHFLK